MEQKTKKVAVGVRSGRSHHRTTILTTDNETYRRVRNLKSGEEMTIEFVNDIISSAKGGNSVVHTPIRRFRLLGRQISGNYRRVKVRSEQGVAIRCLIVGNLVGREDACSCRVNVCRDYLA